jgi:AcrR family transcriptional regulator
MVRSAAALIRRRGLSAASFAEVIADSGAPRGSIYHHFPQGKDQLAEEAIQATSQWVLAKQGACGAKTPAGVLDCFVDLWRQVVVASHGAAGCVVAGVAVDTMPEATELMAAVRASFDSWVELLASQLRAAGLPAARSRSVATAALAAMEGALILCRAERSVEPLEVVAGQLRRLVAP